MCCYDHLRNMRKYATAAEFERRSLGCYVTFTKASRDVDRTLFSGCSFKTGEHITQAVLVASTV